MSQPDQPTRRSFSAVRRRGPGRSGYGRGHNAAQRECLCVEPTRSHQPGRRGPNDRIRIATIGMGIIEIHRLRDTALKVPGRRARRRVRPVRRPAGPCQGGLRRQGRNFGRLPRDPGPEGCRRGARLRPRPRHAQISIDAMKAGKAVYCEKPMVRRGRGRPQVIDVQKQTGRGLPGGEPVRQLGPLRQGQGPDQEKGRSARSTRSRPGTTATPTSALWAVLDPDRRLARNRGLGPLPGNRTQAAVRPRAFLPLEELLGLRHRRRGRPVRPSPSPGFTTRPAPWGRTGSPGWGPALLEGWSAMSMM